MALMNSGETILSQQQQVLLYRQGYLAVQAVPGAGKTTTLAHLAARLVSQGCCGTGRVLVVTYMNAAVANFKDRVRGFLTAEGHMRGAGCDVRTIHSLSLSLLREFGREIGLDDNFRVLDESKQNKLLLETAGRWLHSKGEKWVRDFVEPWGFQNSKRLLERAPGFMVQLVSRIKGYGIHPRELLGAEGPILSLAARVYQDYQAVLEENGVLDYNDLTRLAVTLLDGDEELCSLLRLRWPYVLEDEAQDSNRLQERLLLLLAGEEGNLVRVGDANQAVMGSFTSSDPGIFRSFTQRTGVRLVSLTTSGRSSRDIIDLANRLLYWSRREQPEEACRDALDDIPINPAPPGAPVVNPQPSGYAIGYRVFETMEQEVQTIVSWVGDLVRRSPDKTMAVLAPWGEMVHHLRQALESKGISWEEAGAGLGWWRRVARRLAAVCRFLARPYHGRYLARALQETVMPELAGMRELNQWLCYCPVEEILYPRSPLQGFPWTGFDPPATARLLMALEEARCWLSVSRLPRESILLFLADRLGLHKEEMAVAQGVADGLRNFGDPGANWNLEDLALALEEPGGSFEHLAVTLGKGRDYRPLAGTVCVATMHRAKGMEWDTVFLTGLTDYEFPATTSDHFRGEFFVSGGFRLNPIALGLAEMETLNRSNVDMDPTIRAEREVIAERLRLLYVGITRARENLFLSCHRSLMRTGGRVQKTAPAASFRTLAARIEERRGK